MDPNLHELLVEVQDRLHGEVLALRLVLFWQKKSIKLDIQIKWIQWLR